MTGYRLPHVPAAPLLEAVERRGGPAAAGIPQHSALERAYYRARRAGEVTVKTADRFAVELLREHPAIVWGDAWWTSAAATVGPRR
ncbi:MAG: hypothetical protein ACTHQ3_12815 [Motilibacteraceae bacterium]